MFEVTIKETGHKALISLAQVSVITEMPDGHVCLFPVGGGPGLDVNESYTYVCKQVHLLNNKIVWLPIERDQI